MRPWLVVIGMIFLTLAVGTAATIYFAGQGTSEFTTFDSPPTFSLGPNASQALFLNGSNGSSEEFSLSWHSSSIISFLLQEPRPCPSQCGQHLLLVNWSSNLSGVWHAAGPFNYPLLCVLHNHGSVATNVTVSARALATKQTPPSWGFDLILGAGAVALFVVGGLAVFLGLFLRGDPYGPPRPLISRSAEDVEELARDDESRH